MARTHTLPRKPATVPAQAPAATPVVQATPTQAPATPTVPLLALPQAANAGNPQALAQAAAQLLAAATPPAPATPPVVQPPMVMVIGGSAYNVPKNTLAACGSTKPGKALANPAQVLVLGKPYNSRVAHNAAMWQAIAQAVAAGKGQTTAQAVCNALAAAGVPRGQAMVQYCVRSGWLKQQAQPA